MKLIDQDALKSVIGITSTTCTSKPYQDAMETAVITIDNMDPITVNNPEFTYTTITSTSYPPEQLEDKISFTCPYCGTHYIARDPGFIPNCHNCGAIMRKE